MNHLRSSITICKIVKKSVVLNDQILVYRTISSGVSQGLVLGTHLFLICINDLPDRITSVCKIFAEDTSLFSKVLDIKKPINELNLLFHNVEKWPNIF